MFCVLLLLLSLTRLTASENMQSVIKCSADQYACRNGSCIPLAQKCNGIVNCPDGSDEAHIFCYNHECTSDQFRCTYGGCVNGTAPCNSIPECADFSDELLPKCRKEQHEEGSFKCFDGSLIQASSRCDGTKDCADGSDEILWTCAGSTCPSDHFQCAYGACVDKGAMCNKIIDCADASDEATQLCELMNSDYPTSEIVFRNCTFPPQPKNGRLEQLEHEGMDGLSHDGEFSMLHLKIICDPGYHVGIEYYSCFNGKYDRTIPDCLPHCSKVEIGSLLCDVQIAGFIDHERRCMVPDYEYSLGYKIGSLEDEKNVPSCGIAGAELNYFISGARSALKQELPWHAGIYMKNTEPYMQICGGSLVKENVVISAAHCFWGPEKKKPASDFAVAVGKLYRPWNEPHDKDAQKSDVADIKIPPRYQGSDTNFQDDIAIVIVAVSFQYTKSVKPVCLEFDYQLDTTQLTPDNYGKVAGWGLTGDNTKESPVLKVAEMPVVGIEECIAKIDPSFKSFISSDKICAGYQNGTAVCKGDSGGGLSFPQVTRIDTKYFLRGVVSLAPRNQNLCNTVTWATFTHVLKHEHFIRETILASTHSSSRSAITQSTPHAPQRSTS